MRGIDLTGRAALMVGGSIVNFSSVAARGGGPGDDELPAFVTNPAVRARFDQ